MGIPSESDVASLLRSRRGIDVGVAPGGRIGPWSVARYDVADGPWASVIVKWLRDGDPAIDGDRAHPSQLITEQTALEHLADLGIPAPRVIAGDGRLLVLEDLRSHRPLDQLIIERGWSEATHQQLLDAARAIGERHAATFGDADTYYARFADRQSVEPGRELRRFLGHGWDRTSAWATELGLPPSDAAQHEAQEVTATLTTPGTLLAMSNGDSATNNVMVHDRSAIVIDYEFAGFRHCLTDLVDFYLPGPRFVTVPDAVVSGFEDAYRTSAAAGVPEIGDDVRYGHDLAAAALSHAFTRLANFDRIDHRAPGDLSRLERMHGLEQAADLAESRDSFGHLVDWCRSLAGLLRRRWPDTDVATAALPVFLPRG